KEASMAAQESITSPAARGIAAPEVPTAVYAEGLVAGVVGAAVVALWFLLIDTVKGHPFFTPMVLGSALFRGGATAAPVDFEVVLTFTWVHVLVFLVIGIAAARLIALAERNPSFGFGIVLLFVFFEFGFLLACTLFAEPVLQTLAWPEVLIGNL